MQRARIFSHLVQTGCHAAFYDSADTAIIINTDRTVHIILTTHIEPAVCMLIVTMASDTVRGINAAGINACFTALGEADFLLCREIEQRRMIQR